jgi:hypothetical protein
MSPWSDWLDWLKWDCIGAGIIGRILGQWFKVCVSTTRMLFVIVLRPLRGFAGYTSKRGVVTKSLNLQLSGRPSYFRRLSKLAASTFSTLGVWAAITWRPLWNIAGLSGQRILAAILLLVSASWVISLVWICFSKSHPGGKTLSSGHPARAQYIRSHRAKAS